MSRRHSKFAPKEHLALEDLMPKDEELAALSKASATPEASVLRNENSDHIRRALEKIPPHYRLVLVLHDMEGLGTAEVAKVSRLREGTVRVRLHRARLALRKELASPNRRAPRTRRKDKATPKPRSCREIFAALSDYLDHELDSEMCERLENHMAGCTPCEAFLAELEKTVEHCRMYDPGSKAPKSAIKQKFLAEYTRAMESLQNQSL